MGSVSINRLLVIVVVAFGTAFAGTISDGFANFSGGDFGALAKVIEASGAKGIALGISSALTAVVAYLTVPFKGLKPNALNYRVESDK